MADNASEVNTQAQEQPQDAIRDGLLERQASEAGQATQEPAPQQETLTRQQFEAMLAEEKERLRREMQSAKDREIHQTRLAWQQEQERLRLEQEERARLEGMDDEDYGRYVREQQNKMREQQESAQKVRENLIMAVQNETLGQISDKELRAEIEAQINEGQFKSWGELQQAIISKATAKEVAKTKTQMEASIREAVQKELAAQLADTPTPTLGTGLPTRPTRNLSADENISIGFAEAVAAQKRR